MEALRSRRVVGLPLLDENDELDFANLNEKRANRQRLEIEDAKECSEPVIASCCLAERKTVLTLALPVERKANSATKVKAAHCFDLKVVIWPVLIFWDIDPQIVNKVSFVLSVTLCQKDHVLLTEAAIGADPIAGPAHDDECVTLVRLVCLGGAVAAGGHQKSKENAEKYKTLEHNSPLPMRLVYR